VQRLVDPDETDLEVQLNALQVLSDLVLVKPIFAELINARCLDLYKQCLKCSDNIYSK